MNMNIDELKNEWQSLNTVSKESNDSMVKDVVKGKITSAREHLMKQYKTMFSVFAPIACAVLFANFNLFPLYIIVATTIYLVIAGIMDLYMYKGIKGLDLSTEGVTQIATKAKFYRRRHHQFQLILIPMLVILVVLFFSCATGWLRVGMAVGLIVGLAAGIPTYIGIMRDYKQLSR
jgi:hypothetical protein